MRRAYEANRSYFREAYRTGVHGWETDEPSPYAVDFLKRLASHMPGPKLLDLGCGEGRHSIAAAKLGFKVVGVDSEGLALRRARTQARSAGVPDIPFRVADALNLALPPQSFDVVLDYGCLHHQRKLDWRAYRGSLLRVLRPAGFYVLSVFSPQFRLFAGTASSWHIAHGAYRRSFSRSDLESFAGRWFEFVEVREEKPAGFWHLLLRRRPCGVHPEGRAATAPPSGSGL